MSTMTLVMTFKKSTRNTHVYESKADNTPIPTLYIKREAIQASNAPNKIRVTVEVVS